MVGVMEGSYLSGGRDSYTLQYVSVVHVADRTYEKRRQ